MEYLTAQKLDSVTSTMCWCIVLLEDKHVFSNAADHWQQFLHQQQFSVILKNAEVGRRRLVDVLLLVALWYVFQSIL